MPRSRVRMIMTVGAVGAALLVAPQAAYAVPTTVGPLIVVPGGTVTLNDPTANFNTTTTSVLLTQPTAALPGCPGTFALAGGNGLWNGTVNTRTAGSINFTVPSVNGPAAGTNGTVKAYNVCVFDGTTQNASPLKASTTIYVGYPAAVNPTSGVTGGGNQLTVTAPTSAPLFTGLTAVAGVFSTGSCAAALGSTNPANMVATNVVRQPNNTTVTLAVPPGVTSGTGGSPMTYNLCLYDGSSATGGLLTFLQYTATSATVNPASGSYLSGAGVTLTSPTAFLSGVTAPGALLVGPGGGCPGTYSTAPMGTVTPIAITSAGGVRRLSNNRAVVNIPPLPLMNNQPTTYQVCIYTGAAAGATLVGSGAYTASVVANPTAIMPAAGPASGGNMVTVVGTDFPTDPGRITATLGGAPLTNIQPISDKAFTATVPAHAVEENVPLVVSTIAGTKALPGAYSYRNPIKVSPNTAPSTSPSVDVSVVGQGFMSINFGATGTAGRVFLVNGVYNGADAGGGVRANGPVAECMNVLPISDEELICTLQLNRRLNALGTAPFDSVTYSNSLNDVSTTAGSRTIVTTSGKFGPGDVGQPIVQGSAAAIPAGTIITSVLSTQRATISVPALTTSGGITAMVGAMPVHNLNGLTTTTGSTTVGLMSGAFTRDDVGRVLMGAGTVPGGVTITAVAPGGASATISAPATGSTSGTLANVTIADNSTILNGSSLATTDLGAIIGPNSIGIPPGTTITSVAAGTSATLSAPAPGGGTAASLPVVRPITGNLFAAAPVPDGSYNLVVVSDGAPDAPLTDPDYFQTDVTSSSAFTVASF
ncbi:IPT/TIG domain-containing protein [Paractinoplanes globisporus]|uniref:IPT/TIG domain-containing protein n=1 Tax=Paractinoplanes globisporus TaxID=113565 RepID=A0ABW6WQG9_9ACTN|nr:IPT/TIG domain-containing protein [Actinoplanes globisporus]